MLMQKTKRPIGQILLDAGFLSRQDLTRALTEQKRTNELLGQVLVRMGVVHQADINLVLAVQENLHDPKHAARTAAGVRQMLGALLVQAGQITEAQLEQAIDEQKRTGEKLGQVLVRNGLLAPQQLHNLLDFQKSQSTTGAGPLRLGEILVATGVVSRSQLEDALAKQTASRKKLGEVLIEEGYAQPHQVKRGIRLQHMLLTAVLVGILAGCGGGGGNSVATATGTSTATTASNAASTADQQNSVQNYLTVTHDEYGLLKPNFYYSSNNDSYWSIQADVAQNVWDPNFKTVIRIDVSKNGDGAETNLNGKTFSIEPTSQYPQFPGTFVVTNGEKSVLKRVERGTISFTTGVTSSGEVSGSFDVYLTDYDSGIVPAPQYHLIGNFNFTIGTYGPAASAAAAAS